jgi:adenylate kinase
MTVVVLLGGPGAGKGTQADLLAERMGIPHVATGDIFRAAVRDGSPIGLEARRYMERGQLVPDEITVKMLLARIEQPDAVQGVILDGFPRNRAQAEALDAALATRGARVDHAVSIDVPADELVRRMSGRWVCRDHGHVYNESTNPPRVPGRCDLDDSPLVQRADDKAETIRARMAIQLSSLADVIAYYASTGVLRHVDGLGGIDEVAEAVRRALEAAASEAEPR